MLIGTQGGGIISVYTISNVNVLPITQSSRTTQTELSTPQIYDDYTIVVGAWGSGGGYSERWFITPDYNTRLLYTEYWDRNDEQGYYTDANGNRLNDSEAQQLLSQYSNTPAVRDWYPLSHFFDN